MSKKEETGIDFIVDKLTNSIENVITGDCFATEIAVLTKNDPNLLPRKMVGYLIGKVNLKNP